MKTYDNESSERKAEFTRMFLALYATDQDDREQAVMGLIKGDGWPQNPQTGDTDDAATCTQCDADNTLVTYSHTEYPHGVQFWLCENCFRSRG